MNKWIEIKNQEPKKHHTVLTYGKPQDGGVYISICSYSDGIWRFWESDKENKHTVTHWMPLPDPPTE